MKKKLSLILAVSILTMIFAGPGKSQTSVSKSSDKTDKVYNLEEVEQRPQITKKPRPTTGGAYGECSGTGRVKIQAVFRNTGKVTNIKMLEASPCRNFNENALEAIRKIKFKPGLKDGQPVSVLITMEYVYEIV